MVSLIEKRAVKEDEKCENAGSVRALEGDGSLGSSREKL